jgi:hypothetical protein
VVTKVAATKQRITQTSRRTRRTLTEANVADNLKHNKFIGFACATSNFSQRKSCPARCFSSLLLAPARSRRHAKHDLWFNKLVCVNYKQLLRVCIFPEAKHIKQRETASTNLGSDSPPLTVHTALPPSLRSIIIFVCV